MNRKDKSGGGRGGKKRKNNDGNTPKKTNKRKAKNRATSEDESRSEYEGETASSQDVDVPNNYEQSQEIFEARFPENDNIVTMGVNEDEERALNESLTQGSSDEEEDGEIIFNSSQEAQIQEESINNNATTANISGQQVGKENFSQKARSSKISKGSLATVTKDAKLTKCREGANLENRPGRDEDRNQLNSSENFDETAVRQQLINDTIQRTMEQLFADGRIRMEEDSRKQKEVFRYKSPLYQAGKQLINSNSDLTIYERAVKDKNRNSSSSEEAADTSDETLNLDQNPDSDDTGSPENNNVKKDNNTNKGQEVQFIECMIDQIADATRQKRTDDRRSIDRRQDQAPVLSTSRGITRTVTAHRDEQSPEEIADQLIKQAELSKAQVYETPGKQIPHDSGQILDLSKQFIHSAMVDENYKIVGAHVDPAIKTKIINHEYVDFCRLIAKDRVMVEDDNKIQWVIRQGIPCCVPQVETTGINSYSKWDQAFKVFTAIYTEAHPHKTGELIQYNHIIHTASQVYTWDNVYMYDKDFRIHISQYPLRSWAVVLQLAWNLRLTEKWRNGYGSTDRGASAYTNNNNNNDRNRYGNKEECRKFNRGRCTYGLRCKFEHRCSHCKRMGHGYYSCRKVEQNSRNNNSYNNNQQQNKEVRAEPKIMNNLHDDKDAKK